MPRARRTSRFRKTELLVDAVREFNTRRLCAHPVTLSRVPRLKVAGVMPTRIAISAEETVSRGSLKQGVLNSAERLTVFYLTPEHENDHRPVYTKNEIRLEDLADVIESLRDVGILITYCSRGLIRK